MRRLPTRWWEAEDMPWEDIATAALATICPTIAKGPKKATKDDNFNLLPTYFDEEDTVVSDATVCLSPSEASQCCTSVWSFLAEGDDDEVPFDEPTMDDRARHRRYN